MAGLLGAASIGVDTRDPSMPAPGASTKPCFCYNCSRQETAAECLDLELRCLRCGDTCVEVLEEGEAPPTQPSAHPSSSANLYAAVPAQSVIAQAHTEPSDSNHEPPPESASVQSLRRPRRSDTARRRLQGPIGARARLGGEGARHVGVICDGCRTSSFTGVRYRCLRCRDYDLCAACHARRSVLHPSHPFEAIRTPRSTVPALVADFMAQSATRTVVAIFEIGLEAADAEAHSGLDDSRVAWWLAHDHRLVSADRVAVEDPAWCCPICSEGLEAEGSNGWVVQICTGKGPSIEGAREGGVDGDTADGGAEAAGAPPEGQGHVYHEACLRKWLLKRNSCPVCRRSPIVPEL